MSPSSLVSETDDLKAEDKHIFVLSEAGKPIYTLNGDEEMLVSLFGVMQVYRITELVSLDVICYQKIKFKMTFLGRFVRLYVLFCFLLVVNNFFHRFLR